MAKKATAPARRPAPPKQAARPPQSREVLLPPQDENLPDFLRNYRGPLGTENIDSEDITIPRLKIGQSMSDEVKEGTIPEGALFLNFMGEPLWEPGDKPLTGIIVHNYKEFILWRPRKDGGGILARAKRVENQGIARYAWDKPNTAFDVRVDGKVKVTWRTKRYIDEDGLDKWNTEIPGEDSGPAATVHFNYIVVLPGKSNVVAAISMARSAVKKAKDLNAMFKMRGHAVWGNRLAIETVDDQNTNGDKFKNWKIRQIGIVSNREEFAVYDRLAAGFRTATFNVMHDDDDSVGGGSRGDRSAGMMDDDND